MQKVEHILCCRKGEKENVFVLILTFSGAPFIYYGDEIGMSYMQLVSFEGGYQRTGSRTPMQWDDSYNCGFSSADADKLYLPQDPNPQRPTVKAQMEDATSLWHTVKELIEIRQRYTALQSTAKMEFLQYGYPLVYRRSTETQSMLIINNCKNEPTTVAAKGKIVYTVGGKAHFDEGNCILEGCTAVIIEE